MNGKMLFYGLITLVDDPEVMTVGKGNLCKFRGAWNEKKKEEKVTSFANFECWNEYKNNIMMQFLKKGKSVHVRGSMVEDSYENKDGVKIRTYRFRVEDFDLIDRAEESKNEKPQLDI